VALDEGAAARPHDQLLVGRAALLVAVAKGKERLEAWGDWQEVGRVKVRLLRGQRCCIAFVIQEGARTGVAGEPVPNIRPGDIVYRASGAGGAPSKPSTPPGKSGP
jgi:hypothetical protein